MDAMVVGLKMTASSAVSVGRGRRWRYSQVSAGIVDVQRLSDSSTSIEPRRPYAKQYQMVWSNTTSFRCKPFAALCEAMSGSVVCFDYHVIKHMCLQIGL